MRSTTRSRLALCSVVAERAHWAHIPRAPRRLICRSKSCVWCAMGAVHSSQPLRDLSDAALADAWDHLLKVGEGS